MLGLVRSLGLGVGFEFAFGEVDAGAGEEADAYAGACACVAAAGAGEVVVAGGLAVRLVVPYWEVEVAGPEGIPNSAGWVQFGSGLAAFVST